MIANEWWTGVTQPQATIGAAVITLLGAIIAVLLGWVLFSAKVKDMRSALSATDELVKAHRSSVEISLRDIEEKISGLAVSAGQLRGEASDREAAEEAAVESVGAAEVPVGQTAYSKLANAWFAIRDHLERIAADPEIDGRTAAKYARIDRRSYGDLVASLARDNQLPHNSADYYEAVQLWARFRTRRKPPSEADASRMAELATKLVPVG